MLDQCTVRCEISVSADKDGVTYNVEQGQVYTVYAHSIDKSKWYVVFEGNEWVLFDKWAFSHVITQYAVKNENSYGPKGIQLPILNDEGKSLSILTPTGYVNTVSKEDVTIGTYPYPWHIDSSEARFR